MELLFFTVWLKLSCLYLLDFSAQAGLQLFLLHFSIHHSWENRRRNRYGVLCLLRPWQITIHQHPSFKKRPFFGLEEQCNLPSVPGVEKITWPDLNQRKSCSIFLELFIEITTVFKRKCMKAFIGWPWYFVDIFWKKRFNTIIFLLHNKNEKIKPHKILLNCFVS